jgi:hypothetical protein
MFSIFYTVIFQTRCVYFNKYSSENINTDYQFLQYEWVTLPRYRIEGREIRGKYHLKMFEDMGCEKYETAKIMRVKMVYSFLYLTLY